MTKLYENYSFRRFFPLLLFVWPQFLFSADITSGEPGFGKNTEPESDTLAAKNSEGHLACVIVPTVNCTDQTVTLGAFLHFNFTGVSTPVTVSWSTGQVAQKITVPGGAVYSYDDTGLGCDHHLSSILLPPFFPGGLDIVAPPTICHDNFAELIVESDGYVFDDFTWSPPYGNLTPYPVANAGTYSLTVTDQLGCTFTDQITMSVSPPVAVALSGPSVICPEGDTGVVTVLPTNFAAYAWEGGQTTSSIIVTEWGFYNVTVTNNLGCTGQASIGILSGQVPVFNIIPSSPSICPGQSDTLRLNGGFFSPHWSNGTVGHINIVNQPGTYSVTVTNSFGCTGTESITIQPLPTPVIQVASTPLCPGGSATLAVTGGTFPQYNWSSGQTTSSITISQPGTYTVTVSGNNICTTSTNAVVSLAAPPISTVATPGLLTCSTNQITLDGTGSSSGANFQLNWTTQGGSFVSGQNTLTPVVNDTGLYILNILNTTNGCSSRDTVAVFSNMQAPPANAGNPAMLTCAVTSLTLGPANPPADTTLQYAWSTVGGHFVSGQTIWNPVVNQLGTYTVTVTNPSNGCTAVSSVVIGQNTAPPNAQIAPPNMLTCIQNTVQLNGSASSSGPNFTYLWTTANGTISGSTTSAITTASTVGTYNLLVTNIQTGCTASTSTTVAADINIPTVAAASPDTLTCAVLNVTIDASASSSGPTFTYNWTTTNGNIQSGGGTLMPVVTLPGTYTLSLLNTANNCTATLSVTVPQDVQPPIANAGQNVTLNCTSPSLMLDGSASSTGVNFIYQWTTPNGNIVLDANTLTPTVNQAGTYNLLVTNQSNGCTAAASTQVVNDANAPVAAIAPPQALTCATTQITVDATASSQGGTMTYSWSGIGILLGQGTLQLTVNQPGIYTLSIVNSQNGCTDTASVNVPQDILAPVALAGPDVLINCFNPTAGIGDNGNPTGPDYTLQWTTTNGNFISPTNGSTANIDAAGVYQILITNIQNGCTDTDDVTVQADFAQPTAEAGNTAELNCVQTSLTLQGSGSTGPNFSYLWTTSGGNIVSGDNTLAPTVNAAGTYIFLVTNLQNGCTMSDQVLITQSADVPIATAGTPQTLTCSLTSTVLNGTGSSTGPEFNYTWTTTNGNIVSGGNTLTPTVDTPGTYLIQVLNTTNNCSAVSSVVIGENVQQPVVNAGNDNTLTCSLTSLALQAQVVSSSSPNISYNWSTTNGQILSGSNTAQPTVGAPGIYVVTVSDASNGCTGTDQVEIFNDVNQPVAAIAQPLTLTCLAIQVTLDATTSSIGSDIDYQWTTQGGNFVSFANPLQPIVNQPGVYTLQVNNTLNGCTQSFSVTVTENVQLPIAEAGQTTELDCDNITATLDGNASSQGVSFIYSWSTTNGQILSGANTLTPQVGAAGDYILTVQNTQNGCSQTDDVLVTQDVQPPTAAIAPPQLLTCILTSATLNGSSSGFGSSPTFTWTTQTGNILSGANTLTPNVNEPGVYTLTVLNNDNGCFTSTQTTVNQDANPPSVQVQPAPKLTCTIQQLTLNSIVPPQTTLQWATANGQIISGANTPTPIVGQPGLYLLNVTSLLNGCTASGQTVVQEETNIPTGVQFQLQPPSCLGTAGELTVQQVQGGVGPFVYSIDGGQTFFPAQDFNDLAPGNYDLVVQDVNGCEVMKPIQVPEPPIPVVTIPPQFSIKLGSDQTLEAIVPPPFPLALVDTVIWEPLDGLTFEGNSTLHLLNPVAQPLVTTTYTVTIQTPEGCKSVARTTVKVDKQVDIYVPNVIWPDDPDSDNSTLVIFARENAVREILVLQVYDRWGNHVFENRNFQPNDTSHGWKGDYKGRIFVPAVFVWWAEVELINGQKVLLEGDVTVVR